MTEAKTGRKGTAPTAMIPAARISSRAATAGMGGLAPHLIFLTLPLALLLHEIITVGLFRHSGLLLTFQDGQLRQVASWDDAIV